MGQPLIQAATRSVGANATENLPGPLDGPVQLRIRTASSSIYVGGNALANSPGAANGFNLNANQEYVFDLYPTAQLSAGAADYQVHVWNSSGSAVDVSYVATAKEA